MLFEFKRTCPSCNKELFYINKGKLKRAIDNNCLCRSCAYTGRRHSVESCLKISLAHKGKPSHLKGKHLSLEHRRKISHANLGKICTPAMRRRMSMAKQGCKTWNKGLIYSEERRRTMSELAKLTMHKPDIRRRHIEGLFNSSWLKVKVDKGQLELLEKWNKIGFKFEPNYAIKGTDFLYYIDGYDPIHNVVLEYDSAYHFRKSQDIQLKDKTRQQNIINLLHPKKFWRYNAVESTWKNVCPNEE